MKDQVIDALDNRIVAYLEADVAGYGHYKRRHNWEGGPALRYASHSWKTGSDVVLYLDASGVVVKPLVRVYLCDMNDTLIEQARELFQGYGGSWFEQSNTILVLDWGMDFSDEEQMLQLVSDKVKQLMEFETCKRTQ